MTKNTIDAEIQELFELGSHMGHKKSRLHPKAAKYVYSIINGISIIDLTKSVTLLHEAEAFLQQQAVQDKKVLVVATKKVGSSVAAELCSSYGISYITTKWLPGLLTNFQTLIKNVQKLKTLKEEKAAGTWDKYVKHEQVKLTKRMNRLQKFYGGLEHMDRIPDFLLVLDIKKEHNAVTEAKKHKLPIVGVVDTNANPETIDYPVISNDDAPEVVSYLLKRLIGVYAEGKKKAPVKKQQEQKKSEQTETNDESEKEAKKEAEKPEKAKKAKTPKTEK